MRIISFAETTPALIGACGLADASEQERKWGVKAGTCRGYCGPAKTVTRRDWKPSYAESFSVGEELQAWNRNPRAGGWRVGTIRLTHAPRPQYTNETPDADYEAEGFRYLERHGLRIWGMLPSELWMDWHERPEILYVVRFELVEVVSNR